MFLGSNNPLLVPEDEKEKLIDFLVVAWESIWMERNRLWIGQTTPNWSEVSQSINKGYLKYWQARLDKKKKKNEVVRFEDWSIVDTLDSSAYE